jgi:drug/metabolite transporter (DMT)-like permease
MRYRAGVPIVIRVVRTISYGLIAMGIVGLAVSLAADEGVNDSGFVPGIGVAFVSIATGGLGLIAASRLQEKRYGRVAIVVVLIAWQAVSTLLIVWVLRPGSLASVPMGSIVAWLIMFGFFGTILAVVTVLALVPLITVLAWLADQIPALRKHGVGDQIRGQRRGSL